MSTVKQSKSAAEQSGPAMAAKSKRPIKGRGADFNPPNRFESLHVTDDFEHLASDDEHRSDPARVATEYLSDESQSVISENDSPDIPFRYSLNPYRGCSHGCSYCYARPSHEYLGLGAGLDFESKILVKRAAPQLLRHFLVRSQWQPEPIILSGVTDPYQPAERQFGVTRGCLEVTLEARQPVAIITKNALVLRDLDLLAELAALRLVEVNVSLSTLDAGLARAMEPRTSSPDARLRALRELSAAGVPARIMVAPIVPGLNDSSIPEVLAAAAEAGAQSAGYVLLRLPLAVLPIFQAWLEQYVPEKRARIEALVRSTRGGELNDSTFGKRMRGAGTYAQQIAQTFGVFRRRYDLQQRLPELDVSQFRAPREVSGQMRLF